MACTYLAQSQLHNNNKNSLGILFFRGGYRTNNNYAPQASPSFQCSPERMGGGLSSYNSFVAIVATTRKKHAEYPNGEDFDTLESARNEIVRLRARLLDMFDEFEAVKRQQVTRALALRP